MNCSVQWVSGYDPSYSGLMRGSGASSHDAAPVLKRTTKERRRRREEGDERRRNRSDPKTKAKGLGAEDGIFPQMLRKQETLFHRRTPKTTQKIVRDYTEDRLRLRRQTPITLHNPDNYTNLFRHNCVIVLCTLRRFFGLIHCETNFLCNVV